MKTQSNLNTMATYVVNALLNEGFILHRYDAYSTNSVYIKLDYGVANSLRISDHRGKSHLSYRFNLLSYIDKQSETTRNGYPISDYPFEMADKLIQDIVVHRNGKQTRYGAANYQQYIKKSKAEVDNEPPKGFWQQAKRITK